MATFLMTWGTTKLAGAQAAPPSAPVPQPAPAAQPASPNAPAAQPAPGPATQPPLAPPAQPGGYPNQYPPPPPGYAYGYPPPAPGYPYPAYGYQRRPPDTVAYHGGPVPAGYHVEERARKGLIISGALLTGIPWAIGLAGVSSANFPNHSGWLVLPVLGPWLTLATRHQSHCTTYNNGYAESDVCIDDDTNGLARTALVFDGLVQATGAVLFFVGISSKSQVLTRDFGAHLHLTPAPIGHQGYGGFVSGEF